MKWGEMIWQACYVYVKLVRCTGNLIGYDFVCVLGSCLDHCVNQDLIIEKLVRLSHKDLSECVYLMNKPSKLGISSLST